MASTRVRLSPESAPGVDRGIGAVLADLDVTIDFPADLADAVDAAVARGSGPEHVDARDVPLVTIDPPTSLDLDQAFAAERRGVGFRVHYAIADVGWFVEPGDPVDRAARRRGVTIYAADRRAPLYPPKLSEAAASLLPDGDRPALLWRIDVDETGEATSYDVRRALVRSRAKLSYAEVQQMLDGGTASEPLRLLKEIGTLREERERARGGVHLPTPEQEVVAADDGWGLELRCPLPVEDWNAQISLLTGLCAARLMIDAGVGLLRTLPAPEQHAVASLRRSARALDVDWPTDTPYPDWIRALDVSDPRHGALAVLATRLLRGAGYLAFVDGAPAEGLEHAAIAAPYAHVTAPLRRLADRYANSVVLAVCAGAEVDPAVREALPLLPGLMGGASQREHAVERAVLDHVEATVLAPRIGETFEGSVVELDRDGRSGVVQLREPVVRARVDGAGLVLGEPITVTLVEADPVSRRVLFRPQ